MWLPLGGRRPHTALQLADVSKALLAPRPPLRWSPEFFALLNNERLAAGKPPLGFLNPFIYQNAAAFNDVTSGKNNAGLGAGFTAIKGWDAATGMGTPDYTKLLAAVQALP